MNCMHIQYRVAGLFCHTLDDIDSWLPLSRRPVVSGGDALRMARVRLQSSAANHNSPQLRHILVHVEALESISTSASGQSLYRGDAWQC
ncbi:MAG: hypothetical protein OEO82_07240, partial [Gammaproteobacteria bacterium]|nr:hypothetical protein [Gammaproteobacteria bacterium]